VSVIPDNIFGACSKLESVTFNGSITQIDPGAFDGCVALNELNFKANTFLPTTVPSVDPSNAFRYVPLGGTIYVKPSVIVTNNALTWQKTDPVKTNLANVAF